VRRLLVTGGAGFIGANFCHYWSQAHSGDRLVVLDLLTYAGNLASLETLLRSGQVRFVRGDIADCDAVAALLREERIDTVVNFAAESHVDRSITDPQRFLLTNVMGTQALLEAVRQVWTASGATAGRRFHHVSTDEVYGSLEPSHPGADEGSPYAPNSPYAASKAAADHLVRAYARTYGVPCSISNCSNNYGPYQFPEKLLPLCILNILQGRALPIYGDGLQVRDWLHVSDHCRAIDTILLTAAAGDSWNIGGSSDDTNLTVVQHLCDLVDAAFQADSELARRFPGSPPARGNSSRGLIEHVRDRPGHDRRYCVNSAKLKSRLGFSAVTPLAAGLAATVAWYLANEAWWRPVVSGEYRYWYESQYAPP
jgi:dTDP-glucose 4,6-dehydratase